MWIQLSDRVMDPLSIFIHVGWIQLWCLKFRLFVTWHTGCKCFVNQASGFNYSWKMAHYVAQVFLSTVPSASNIYIFVKIKDKPIGFELCCLNIFRSADPSQIFSLVLWPLGHEDISVWDNFITQVMTWFNFVNCRVRSLCCVMCSC